MRFLVDECTGPVVARWLLEQKHEVFSVYDAARYGRRGRHCQSFRRKLDFDSE